MTRARVRAILVGLAAIAASAHVGSPDAWYEGEAGPYHVLVHVAAPGVIPGIATVRVRVEGATVDRVTAVADHVAATGGAPPAEVLEPLADEPGWYRTQLWIMTTGSYSVTVTVTGSDGAGSAVVPLGAIASRRLQFGKGLGVVLGAAGIVLFVGLLTIVGAVVREGVVPPEEVAGPSRARAARRAMVRGAAVLALLLYGGWRWWQIEDERFVRSMFRPMTASAAAEGGQLTLAIQDSSWIMRHDEGWRGSHPGAPHPDLLADHGKVMHLFMVDGSGGGAFAHLHPRTADSVIFQATLPPLPPGRYSVFGDIVQTTGFAQTLVASIELPSGVAGEAIAGDPDDSWALTTDADRGSALLADGSTLRWLGADEPLLDGEPAALEFALTAPAGDSVALELYMGMPAHAAVVREDHGVFVHLHPMGTISMAAQARLMERAAPLDGSAAERAQAPHSAHATSATITFPYAFPEPGRYFVWVQIKRAGRVLTGRFEAQVERAKTQMSGL